MRSPVPSWTSARYFSFIRGGLRRMFTRYPPKYKCLTNARVSRGKYRCASCGGVFSKKNIAVDHIKQCGSLNTYGDLPAFVENMFCPLGGLQVLCNSCHRNKSMRERGMTDEDIAAAWFKKMKAADQRKHLKAMNVEPGKNAEERVKQYLENL